MTDFLKKAHDLSSKKIAVLGSFFFFFYTAPNLAPNGRDSDTRDIYIYIYQGFGFLFEIRGCS